MPECDKNSPCVEEEEESFYRLTFYEVLGVSEGATADDIKRAYKRGILEYHPDKNTSLDVTIATKRFRRVQEAYEVLADPQQRRQYDIQRNPQRHRYVSTQASSNTTPPTTQTYTHHHYHFRPPTTTPMHSFSFMFSSSAQASFSFGFSSSPSSSPPSTTATRNGEDDNAQVLWSFTTRRGGHDNEPHPAPSATTRQEASNRKNRSSRPSSASESSSEYEDEVSSSE